ncbi:uncharacterized protein [Haliotis cracherodii]|uniref:uncharacterized protein n=1 Tax=Haliotis cracherodii TaxID=6455 RepID=UPI0039E8580A
MLVGTGHIEDNCTSLNNTATAKMNTVLGLLALCCSVASVHAACNILACSLTGSILGTEGCATYNLYIECLKDEVGACTSSQVVEKASLDAAITSNTVLMNALPCSAAGGIYLSLASLLMAFIALFMKQ